MAGTIDIKISHRSLTALADVVDAKIQPALYALERATEVLAVYRRALREIAEIDAMTLQGDIKSIAQDALAHPDGEGLLP